MSVFVVKEGEGAVNAAFGGYLRDDDEEPLVWARYKCHSVNGMRSTYVIGRRTADDQLALRRIDRRSASNGAYSIVLLTQQVVATISGNAVEATSSLTVHACGHEVVSLDVKTSSPVNSRSSISR